MNVRYIASPTREKEMPLRLLLPLTASAIVPRLAGGDGEADHLAAGRHGPGFRIAAQAFFQVDAARFAER